jgi:hypothetical protein
MEQQPTIIRRKHTDNNTDAMHKVSEILKSVNYGSITLIVQGGKIYQINKTENCRLTVSGEN